MRWRLAASVAIALAMRFGGVGTLRTRRLGGHALRSVLNMITMVWRKMLFLSGPKVKMRASSGMALMTLGVKSFPVR